MRILHLAGLRLGRTLPPGLVERLLAGERPDVVAIAGGLTAGGLPVELRTLEALLTALHEV